MAYYPIPSFSGDGVFSTIKPIIQSPIDLSTITFPIKQYTEDYVSWVVDTGAITEKRSCSTNTPFITICRVLKNGIEDKVGELNVSTISTDLVFSGEEELTYSFTEYGTYLVEYQLKFKTPSNSWYYATITYSFNVVENHYRTKPWTITEVINRTFDLIEPLDYGEKPRFRLSGVGYDNEGNSEFIESGKLKKRGKIPRFLIWI